MIIGCLYNIVFNVVVFDVSKIILFVIMVFWEVFWVIWIGKCVLVLLVLSNNVFICVRWYLLVVWIRNWMLLCLVCIVFIVLRKIGSSVFILLWCEFGSIVNIGVLLFMFNIWWVVFWLGFKVIVLVMVCFIKVYGMLYLL